MYLGSLDERIKFLFSILNMENLNKINISNIKIFFSHLKAMEKTTEKEMEKGYFLKVFLIKKVILLLKNLNQEL